MTDPSFRLPGSLDERDTAGRFSCPECGAPIWPVVAPGQDERDTAPHEEVSEQPCADLTDRLLRRQNEMYRAEEVSEPSLTEPTTNRLGWTNPPVGGDSSLISSLGGPSVTREAREAFHRWCDRATASNAQTFMVSYADELLDAAEAVEAELVAVAARAEQAALTIKSQSRYAEHLRAVIASRTDRAVAAEARTAELANALERIAGDLCQVYPRSSCLEPRPLGKYQTTPYLCPVCIARSALGREGPGPAQTDTGGPQSRPVEPT